MGEGLEGRLWEAKVRFTDIVAKGYGAERNYGASERG